MGNQHDANWRFQTPEKGAKSHNDAFTESISEQWQVPEKALTRRTKSKTSLQSSSFRNHKIMIVYETWFNASKVDLITIRKRALFLMDQPTR